MSDYSLQNIGPWESEDRYWVVVYGFRYPSCEADLGELMSVGERTIKSMYFMLTTLSTVGYGDMSPQSINERMFGSMIMMVGVTIFTIVMQSFIDIVMSILDSDASGYDDELSHWFTVIKATKNGYNINDNRDISEGLKNSIEKHFNYFWDQDRVEILKRNPKLFSAIPAVSKSRIVEGFMFSDILDRTSFSTFFDSGRASNEAFAYEVCFGLMPREYLDDPVDRYILDEEGDCTEITFILSGEWAIAFNSFEIRQPDESFDDYKADEEN
jgi:hypothetical protein